MNSRPICLPSLLARRRNSRISRPETPKTDKNLRWYCLSGRANKKFAPFRDIIYQDLATRSAIRIRKKTKTRVERQVYYIFDVGFFFSFICPRGESTLSSRSY